MGYDVDATATRLSNYLHVLRELVHLSCGHLALEPRFDVKALLGDHLHDDARAVSKIRRRLDELARRARPRRAVRRAHGAARPRRRGRHERVHRDRLRRAQADADRGDPRPPRRPRPAGRRARACACSPSSLHRQERHVAELPAERRHTAFEDLGALPIRPGEVRPLKVMEPLDRPARDAFVEVTDSPPADDGQKRSFHGLMDAELCAAELTARNSHEHPDMPWDFHVDMARQTWDEIRHAEIFDRLMATELGCHWGDYPVGFSDFRSVYALDLAGRLAVYDGISEQMAQQRQALVEGGQDELARVFDYLLGRRGPPTRATPRAGAD